MLLEKGNEGNALCAYYFGFCFSFGGTKLLQILENKQGVIDHFGYKINET